jgi:hypothetical protein
MFTGDSVGQALATRCEAYCGILKEVGHKMGHNSSPGLALAKDNGTNRVSPPRAEPFLTRWRAILRLHRT